MSVVLGEDSSKLYAIRKAVMRMLHDRHYDVAAADLRMTEIQFCERFGDEPIREDLMILKSMQGNDDDKILVFFPDEPKVGVTTVQWCADRMTRERVTRAILVVQQGLQSYAKQCIHDMASGKHFEIFKELEVLVNLNLDHGVLRDHVFVPSSDMRAVLLAHQGDGGQIGWLKDNEPLARYFGLKRGEVATIIRSTDHGGNFACYEVM